MRIIATTLVAMRVAGLHPVEYPHHPAATATANETGQQRPYAASGLA